MSNRQPPGFVRFIFNSQPYLRWLDVGLGAGCLAYGFYVHSYWWMAGGVIGLALAWYNPAERLKAHLRAKMIKRY